MSIQNLPACPLEARALLITQDAAHRARLAVDYIKNRYPQGTMFQDCTHFVDHDVVDCMRSDFESLGRVWFFPATEAADELSECLNRMLESSFKASRENLRRALELILLGAFFSHSRISPSEAKSWLKSTRGTPYFASTLKELVRFHLCDSTLRQDSTVVDSMRNAETRASAGKAESASRLAKLGSFCVRAVNRIGDRILDPLLRVLACIWFGTEQSSNKDHAVSEGNKRQLESCPNPLGSLVLPNRQGVLGAGGGGVQCQEAAPRQPSRDRGESDARETLMPFATLKPHNYLKVRYPVPKRGLIEYKVEAERPVVTFILDEEGLAEFLGKGEDIYSYYGGFSNRYEHHQELRLPFRGWWYLVIENNQDEPVKVYYEVNG